MDIHAEEFHKLNPVAKLLTPQPGGVLIVSEDEVNVAELAQLEWPPEWEGTLIVPVPHADDIRLLPLRRLAKLIIFKRTTSDPLAWTEDDVYESMLTLLSTGD